MIYFKMFKFFIKNNVFNGALAVVDRVIKTICLMFKKLFVKRDFIWIHDLHNIDDNYNETYHSTIQNLPNNVFYK